MIQATWKNRRRSVLIYADCLRGTPLNQGSYEVFQSLWKFSFEIIAISGNTGPVYSETIVYLQGSCHSTCDVGAQDQRLASPYNTRLTCFISHIFKNVCKSASNKTCRRNIEI